MFPLLFSPFLLKGIALKNRIASTPHSDGMAEDGLVTERLLAYFSAKAAGGAGLIMGPAGCAVHATSPTRAGGLELYRPEAVPRPRGPLTRSSWKPPSSRAASDLRWDGVWGESPAVSRRSPHHRR